MEILRPGDKNRVECGGSGSYLKLDQSDIGRRAVPLGNRYDGDDYTYAVRCPECHTTIDVSGKIAPAIARLVAERETYLDHDP
jgi:hypothetical protein